MLGAGAHPQAVEDLARAFQPLRRWHSRECEWKGDVVDDAIARKQIERLEDHADALAAMSREGFFVQLREIFTVDTHGPSGGSLETGDDV